MGGLREMAEGKIINEGTFGVVEMSDVNRLQVIPTAFGYFNVSQKHGFEDISESISVDIAGLEALLEVCKKMAY